MPRYDTRYAAPGGYNHTTVTQCYALDPHHLKEVMKLRGMNETESSSLLSDPKMPSEDLAAGKFAAANHGLMWVTMIASKALPGLATWDLLSDFGVVHEMAHLLHSKEVSLGHAYSVREQAHTLLPKIEALEMLVPGVHPCWGDVKAAKGLQLQGGVALWETIFAAVKSGKISLHEGLRQMRSARRVYVQAKHDAEFMSQPLHPYPYGEAEARIMARQIAMESARDSVERVLQGFQATTLTIDEFTAAMASSNHSVYTRPAYTGPVFEKKAKPGSKKAAMESVQQGRAARAKQIAAYMAKKAPEKIEKGKWAADIGFMSGGIASKTQGKGIVLDTESRDYYPFDGMTSQMPGRTADEMRRAGTVTGRTSHTIPHPQELISGSKPVQSPAMLEFQALDRSQRPRPSQAARLMEMVESAKLRRAGRLRVGVDPGRLDGDRTVPTNRERILAYMAKRKSPETITTIKPDKARLAAETESYIKAFERRFLIGSRSTFEDLYLGKFSPDLFIPREPRAREDTFIFGANRMIDAY